MNAMLQEIANHPKTATALIGSGAGTNAVLAEWSLTDPNTIAAIVGIIGTLITIFFLWRKDQREQREHERRMKDSTDKRID